MSDEQRTEAAGTEGTTVVYAHAVIARLLNDDLLLTLRHRTEGWLVLPGGVIRRGENVRDGLRARVREVLGVEIGDIVFHTAIEDEPQPERNQVRLVFDTSLVGEDDVDVVSRDDLWDAVWIRWDDVATTDLYPELIRRRLPIGRLRDEAWWSPASAPVIDRNED